MTQPITVEPATEQQLTAAALIALAEGILHGLVPMPTSIDVWVQGITGRQLVTIADEYSEPIILSRRADDTPVQANVGHKLTTQGVKIELHAIAADVTPRALAVYETHNRECLTEDGA